MEIKYPSEIQEELKKISKELKSILSHQIGFPASLEQIKDNAVYFANQFNFSEELKDLISKLIVLECGFGSPVEIYNLLKKASNSDIDLLYEKLGPGPGNFIWLEWAFRNNEIISWETTQETLGPNGECTANILFKEPINYISVDFEIDTKNNEGIDE
jgi:hypothetical protein